MNWETEKYPLKYSITVGEVEMTSLELRMPNGKALRAIDGMGLDKNRETDELSLDEIMSLITHFCPTAPEGFTDELHPADIKGAGEKMAPLLSALFDLVGPEPDQEVPQAAQEAQTPQSGVTEPETVVQRTQTPQEAARAAALAEARGESLPQ